MPTNAAYVIIPVGDDYYYMEKKKGLFKISLVDFTGDEDCVAYIIDKKTLFNILKDLSEPLTSVYISNFDVKNTFKLLDDSIYDYSQGKSLDSILSSKEYTLDEFNELF